MISHGLRAYRNQTVSRVLNKQTNISPEARDKVLKAIDELKLSAQQTGPRTDLFWLDAIMVISTRSTKTTAGNPFFSDVLHAITTKAEEEGFDVILQTSKSSEDDLLKCVSKIKQKMIKGVIMLSSPANESFFSTLDALWRTPSSSLAKWKVIIRISIPSIRIILMTAPR